MELHDSQARRLRRHLGRANDLDRTTAREGNLREQEGGRMVRMFRRLLRGGSKQRVAGIWVF